MLTFQIFKLVYAAGQNELQLLSRLLLLLLLLLLSLLLLFEAGLFLWFLG